MFLPINISLITNHTVEPEVHLRGDGPLLIHPSEKVKTNNATQKDFKQI